MALQQILKEVLPLDPERYPAILELKIDHETRLYNIGRSRVLNLERLVRTALRGLYGDSGYAVRGLKLSPAMGGPNWAAIRTADHFDWDQWQSMEQAQRELDESVVVWESGDVYFDLL